MRTNTTTRITAGDGGGLEPGRKNAFRRSVGNRDAARGHGSGAPPDPGRGVRHVQGAQPWRNGNHNGTPSISTYFGFEMLGFRVSGFTFRVWSFASGFRVSDFGFRISDLRFRVWVSCFEFRFLVLGFRVSVFVLRMSRSGFRVSGFDIRRVSGCDIRVSGGRVWAYGLGFRDTGFVFRVSGFGVRVSVLGFGFRVSGLGFQFRVLGFRFRVSRPVLGLLVPSG